MSDLPPRLLDDPALSPVARAVLESATADAPTSDRRDAVAKGLGLTALIGGSAASSSASAAAWWLAPMIVVAVATTGAIGWLVTRPAERATVTRVTTTTAEPAPAAAVDHGGGVPAALDVAPVAAADPAPAAVPAAVPSAVDVHAHVDRVRPRARSESDTAVALPSTESETETETGTETGTGTEPGALTPVPSNADRLAAEVALLDSARAALAAGHAATALAALDRHAAEFPQPFLAAEATLLRIDALLQNGDRDAATALGDRFLHDYPSSPLAKRVRSLLARKAP